MCQATHNPNNPVGRARYGYACPAGGGFPNGSVDEVVLTLHLSGQSLGAAAIATRRNRLRRRCGQLNNHGGDADVAQTNADLTAGLAAGYLLVSGGGMWTLAHWVVQDLANQVPLPCAAVDVTTP